MDDVGVRMSGPITSSDDVEVYGVCTPMDQVELAGRLDTPIS